MIWPSGPPKRLKSLSRFTNDVFEPFTHMAISKNSFYAVISTEHRIALYRLKPLAPACFYSDSTAAFSHIAISHSGKFIAAQSGLEIVVFQVSPDENFNEVLRPRTNTNRSAGPGEALGIRELQLTKLATLKSSHEIVEICTFQDYFVVVSPEHMQFCAWTTLELEPVHTGSILDDLKVVHASHSVLLSRLCLLCDNDQLFLVHIKRDQFKALPLPDQSEPPLATCFNLRFAKVVVAYPTKLLLYNVKDIDESPVTVPLGRMGAIRSLEWSPMGQVLMVGHSEGWCLISVLGMMLYSSSVPVRRCEWSVGSDELFLLTETCEVLSYETTRMFYNCSENLNTPILYSVNRVQIYCDNSKNSLPSNPWITVPVSNLYLGLSWPIVTAVASANGKYIAIAGSYGLIYLSVAERQWKLFSERDIMVRGGGILWYFDFLILSIISGDHKGKIEIYSTAIKGSTVSDEEEQVVASLSFSSAVVTMSLRESQHELAVLLHNGRFLKYDIRKTPQLLSDDSLLDVFRAPGRVRSMGVLSSDKSLFLIDDRLVLVSSEGNGFIRRTVHAPVEYFFIEQDDVWVFTGEGMTIINTHSMNKFAIDLDFYPVGVNRKKGLVSTIEATDRLSFDRSFKYIEPVTDLEVYLPSLFEISGNKEELAKRYHHLDYFDDIMESTLYHCLVEKPEQLEETMKIIKQYCKWPTVAARCARKTETKYWERLFEAIGEPPEALFGQALDTRDLETAAEYLMILQALFKADPGDSNMIKLYSQAMDAGNFDICKQLSEFLLAIDTKGTILEQFIKDLDIYSPCPED